MRINKMWCSQICAFKSIGRFESHLCIVVQDVFGEKTSLMDLFSMILAAYSAEKVHKSY